MAQADGSFLYQLKLQLDDSGALVAIDEQADTLKRSVTGLENRFESLEAQIKRTAKGMDLRGLRRRMNLIGRDEPLKGFRKGLSRGRWQVQQLDKGLRDLMLSGAQLETATGRSLDQFQRSLVQSSSAAKKLTVHGQDLSKAFARAPGGVNQLRQNLIQSDNALEEVAEQATLTWDGVERGALQSSTGIENVRQDLLQTANASEELASSSNRSFASLKRNSRSTASTVSKSMRQANNRFTKTSQTSQNLLRIMQDAQFGAIGVANNVQALGESLGRASTRGVGALTQLKRGLMNLVMGPFALPAAITGITLLAQNWDSVTNAAEDFASTIGLINFTKLEKDIQGVNDALDKMNEELPEAEKILMNLEGAAAEATASAIKQNIEDAREGLSTLEETFQDSFKRITDVTLEDLAEAETLNEVLNQAELENLRSQVQDPEDRELFRSLVNQFQHLNTLIKRAESNLKLVNSEEEKLEEKARRVAEATTLTFEEAKKRLKQQKDQNDAVEEEIEFQQRLRELQVEAMNEGFQKEIANIRLSIQERKNEVRQMDLKVEKQKQLLNLLNKIQTRREAQAAEQATSEAEMRGGFAGLGFIRIPGVGFVDKDTYIKNQQQQFDDAQREIEARRRDLDAEREIGDPGQFFDALANERIEFQQKMLKKEMELRKQRLRNRIEFLKARAAAAQAAGKTGKANSLLQQAGILQERIYKVEDRWYKKRENLQKQHLRSKLDNLESTELGNAVGDLTMTLGSIWNAFYEDEVNLAEKTAIQKVSILSEMGSQLVSAADNVATAWFQTWKTQRENDLENEGKSQEKRRQILKQEGKKRFQIVKAVKYAEAAVAGISAATKAWDQGMGLGGPPLAATFLATSLAKTALQLRKISQMSIGDRLSGSAGGGGGPAGGEFTQFNQSAAARRAADFGARRKQQQQENETDIDKVAEKVGEEVARNMPDEVTMGRRTAGEAQRVGTDINNKFIK